MAIDTSRVTYTHRLEAMDVEVMDESPDGHFEEDAEACEWIYSQLRDGNTAAWCGIIVTAELEGFKGNASLWACSYESEAQLLAELLEDLKSEALADLERTIAKARERLARAGG